MAYKNVVVAGGFGGVGAFITRALLETKAFSVTVFSRTGAQNDELVGAGAKVVTVDYDSVENLTAALKGVDAVVSAVSGASLYQAQLNLVDAAKAAGVRHFLPSEFGVNLVRVPEAPLFGAKIAVARKLIASGIGYTILSTGIFTDTAFVPFLGLDGNSTEWTVGGDGHAQIALTTRADVGKFVAQVLLHPELSLNKYLAVHASTITPHLAAELFKKVTGRTITIKTRSLGELRNVIKATPANPIADLVEQFTLTLGNGDAAHYNNDASLFPAVHPTTVEEYVAANFK